jgi:hypothetical protein
MVRVAQKRRYKLRDGEKWLGASLEPLLEGPPLLVISIVANKKSTQNLNGSSRFLGHS